MMVSKMERRLSTIWLMVLLLGLGLYGLRGSGADHLLAEPRPRPLADAPWSANVKVNDDPGTADQYSPAIAVDSWGNAYAVWPDYRNGDFDIYFSYRPAGGNWETNVKVNDAPSTAYDPAIAVDSSRNAYAVWEDKRSGNYDIYFSYRPVGGSWDANAKVNDDPGMTGQYDPAIAVTAGLVIPATAVVPFPGSAYVVWQDFRNAHYDIYSSYRPAGGSWGANDKVNDDSGTADQRDSDIAVDSSGNAYVVWRDERNGQRDIYFSFRPFVGIVGLNVKVNDDSGTAYQGYPAIALDSSGNAYAVWEDYRNGDFDIYFSYRPVGGSWETNVKVNDDSGTATQTNPEIAVDPSGNAYAVWSDQRNGNRDIYFSYRPAGGDWGANVKVNDDPGAAWQGEPAIALDSSGNAYAVWPDLRNGDSDIYFSYLPAGYRTYLPIVKKNYQP